MIEIVLVGLLLIGGVWALYDMVDPDRRYKKLLHRYLNIDE